MKTLSTGEIDASKVYKGGLYPVGPNKGFLTFPADAHFEALDGLTVATADENSVSSNTLAFEINLVHTI